MPTAAPAPQLQRYLTQAQWRPDPAPKLDLSAGLVGYCSACHEDSRFELDDGRPDPREALRCRRCGLNARVRAAFALLEAELGSGDVRLYLTEQASTPFVWLQRHYRRVRGSEFAPRASQRLRLSLSLWKRGGLGWVRHEDVTRLSHAPHSFDALLSFDVLEHVPDYRAALAEFFRVLAPGGLLVLTAPFDARLAASEVLALRHVDGRIEHLHPPEYHGDPLGGGVLCFHRFGWDLLDAVRAAGFASAEMRYVAQPEFGLLGTLWLLCARR